MRQTEDYNTVAESELVWEIMYQYINPEVSEPYPDQRLVRLIPPGTRIWVHKNNCQAECDRIIKGKSKLKKQEITSNGKNPDNKTQTCRR